MNVCVIGLGLIGGSMAIDSKQRRFCSKIIGVDMNVTHAMTALKLGIVDEVSTLENAIKKSRLIIVAIPADASISLLPEILDMTDDQIVTDVSSTKQSICAGLNQHPKRANFVAAHPMAGTEFSGPEAAKTGLFDEKATIICEAEKCSLEAISMVKKMYKTLGMRIINMDPASHDIHAAYVSHISHISSFALALTVLEKEEDQQNIFDLASGGFDSTVRLAKSSAAMWAPVLTDNAENIAHVLQTYIDKLTEFKSELENKNLMAIQEKIIEANKIKRVLSNQTASPAKEFSNKIMNNN